MDRSDWNTEQKLAGSHTNNLAHLLYSIQVEHSWPNQWESVQNIWNYWSLLLKTLHSNCLSCTQLTGPTTFKKSKEAFTTAVGLPRSLSVLHDWFISSNLNKAASIVTFMPCSIQWFLLVPCEMNSQKFSFNLLVHAYIVSKLQILSCKNEFWKSTSNL